MTPNPHLLLKHKRGYFGHIAASRWLWGIKFKYKHLGVTSTDRGIVVRRDFIMLAAVGGRVEGQNVAIEYRWAEGQYGRLPAWLLSKMHLAMSVRFRTLACIASRGSFPGAATNR